ISYVYVQNLIGLVQGWAAIIISGSVPWFTMMVVHKKLWLLHTHAVAGYLGGILTGIFAEPVLCSIFLPITNSRSSVYGGVQVFKQIMGGGFIIGWNVVVTSVICVLISFVVQLRMPEKELLIGDDAKYDSTKHGGMSDDMPPPPPQHRAPP
ncbi:hypothetical protein MIMGU_mgv1a026713mg, partial [Erythranthe guttata]